MPDESVEYQSAFAALEEAHKDCLRTFVRWFAAEWQMDQNDWEKTYADPKPEPTWFIGWNAGVESALMALDCFLKEYHP